MTLILLSTVAIVGYLHLQFRKIHMDQAQLASGLTQLATTLTSATTQLSTDIKDLETALGNQPAGTTPEVDSAFASLQATVAALAAAIPDPSTLPGGAPSTGTDPSTGSTQS